MSSHSILNVAHEEGCQNQYDGDRNQDELPEPRWKRDMGVIRGEIAGESGVGDE